MGAIYSIYIGTTKIVGIRGTIDDKKNIVMETLAKVSALGFRQGVVVGLEKASAQIREVVEKIIREDARSHARINVVLSDNLVRMFLAGTSVYFGDSSRTITQVDVDRVIAQTRAITTIPLSEFIILTVPQEFVVNDVAGVRDPLELDARRLGVNLHLFTVANDTIKNINKVFDRLDLTVQNYFPRVMMSAYAVLRTEEKRDGVLLIDVSGHTTSIAYFNNNMLGFYEVLPMGGEYITAYLADNLHISLLEARRLKEQYGSVELLEMFEDEIIPVVDVFGKTRFNINKKRLYDQIHIAAKELADAINGVLKKKKAQNRQMCGAVITGGGANLDGFLDLMQTTIGLTVRIGIARNISGHEEAVGNPAYAAQLGLLDYLLDERNRHERQYEGKNLLTRKMIKVREWIQENF